jgi:hypothetical protein
MTRRTTDLVRAVSYLERAKGWPECRCCGELIRMFKAVRRECRAAHRSKVAVHAVHKEE